MKATFLVHWPGKDTLACDKHMMDLVALGQVLGTKIPVTTFNGDAECVNCENAAKKKEVA